MSLPAYSVQSEADHDVLRLIGTVLARDDQPVTAHQIAAETHPGHLPEIVARLMAGQRTAAEQRHAAYDEWRSATAELAAEWTTDVIARPIVAKAASAADWRCDPASLWCPGISEIRDGNWAPSGLTERYRLTILGNGGMLRPFKQ